METIFNALTFLGNEFALFIISMIPLIELRGAVILGAALDMNWVIVLIVSVIGNMVPIPFLLLFGRKILDWLKTVPLFSKLAHWYEEKLVKKADQINEYAKWGLFLLVAIPLPGTGALDWRFGSNFSEYENASGASHDLFRCACCGNCYGNRFLRSVRCNSFVLIAALLPPRLDEQKALCKKAKGLFYFSGFWRITATKNPKLKKNPTSSKKHGKSRRIRQKQVKQKRIISRSGKQ